MEFQRVVFPLPSVLLRYHTCRSIEMAYLICPPLPNVDDPPGRFYKTPPVFNVIMLVEAEAEHADRCVSSGSDSISRPCTVAGVSMSENLAWSHSRMFFADVGPDTVLCLLSFEVPFMIRLLSACAYIHLIK
jgi:hypothetical protein